MTGFTLTITLDDAQLRGDMRDLIGRLDRPEPFYQAVGNKIQASVVDRFQTETAPDGTPWAPLKPATIAARLRKKRSAQGILRESGALRGSITHQVETGGVRIGVLAGIPYGAIHQNGGTIQAKARQGRIYRRQFADGTFGRRFAKKELKTSSATDVSIRAHSITIPARPYLGVGTQDIDDIRRLADRWLSGQL